MSIIKKYLMMLLVIFPFYTSFSMEGERKNDLTLEKSAHETIKLIAADKIENSSIPIKLNSKTQKAKRYDDLDTDKPPFAPSSIGISWPEFYAKQARPCADKLPSTILHARAHLHNALSVCMGDLGTASQESTLDENNLTTLALAVAHLPQEILTKMEILDDRIARITDQKDYSNVPVRITRLKELCDSYIDSIIAIHYVTAQKIACLEKEYQAKTRDIPHY